MACAALLEQNPNPSDDDIDTAMLIFVDAEHYLELEKVSILPPN